MTRPDTIVYSGCTDEEVAKSVLGKRIKRVGRLGKYFYVRFSDAESRVADNACFSDRDADSSAHSLPSRNGRLYIDTRERTTLLPQEGQKLEE